MRWNSIGGEEMAVLRRQEEARDTAGTGFCSGVLGCDGHVVWRNPSLFLKMKKGSLSVTDDII